MFGYKLLLERIDALQQRIEAVEGHECPDASRIDDIARSVKNLDRDMDDLDAYVKRVLGRVTGAERRKNGPAVGAKAQDLSAQRDLNERIQEGLPI